MSRRDIKAGLLIPARSPRERRVREGPQEGRDGHEESWFRRNCDNLDTKGSTMRTHIEQREPGQTQIKGKGPCGWEIDSLGG